MTTPHYHAVIDGRQRPWEGLATRDEAVELVSRLAAGIADEKKNQGGGATVGPLSFGRGALLVQWGSPREDHPEDFPHGASIIKATSCTTDHTVEAMPGEPLMGVTAEVWPIGASREGIWLLTGTDGLRSGRLPERRLGVQGAVLAMLDRVGITEPHRAMTHGTSCRDEAGNAVQTHIAVVNCPDVLSHWPGAMPISMKVLQKVGRPETHPATDAPERNPYFFVLEHACRHAAWLRGRQPGGGFNDATAAAAMPPLMDEHLATLQPELYRMYSEVHPGTFRAA